MSTTVAGDDDARIDGEAVVNQRDIIMLEKLNEDADDEEDVGNMP